MKCKAFEGERPIFDGERPKFEGECLKFDWKKPEFTDEQKAELYELMKAKLAQALADRKITQEQYDQMKDAFENGEMHMFRGIEVKKFDSECPKFEGECLKFDWKKPEFTDEQKAEKQMFRRGMKSKHTV